MEGKANLSRRLKQFDGLTWLTLTPVGYFTTDLRHYSSIINRETRDIKSRSIDLM